MSDRPRPAFVWCFEPATAVTTAEAWGMAIVSIWRKGALLARLPIHPRVALLTLPWRGGWFPPAP